MYNLEILEQVIKDIISTLSLHEIPKISLPLYNILKPSSERLILTISTGVTNRGKIHEIQEIFEEVYPEAKIIRENNNSNLFFLDVTNLYLEKEKELATETEALLTQKKKRAPNLIVFRSSVTELSEKSMSIRDVPLTDNGEHLLMLFCEGKRRAEILEEIKKFDPFFSAKKYEREREVLLYKFRAEGTSELVSIAKKNGFYP